MGRYLDLFVILLFSILSGISSQDANAVTSILKAEMLGCPWLQLIHPIPNDTIHYQNGYVQYLTGNTQLPTAGYAVLRGRSTQIMEANLTRPFGRVFFHASPIEKIHNYQFDVDLYGPKHDRVLCFQDAVSASVHFRVVPVHVFPKNSTIYLDSQSEPKRTIVVQTTEHHLADHITALSNIASKEPTHNTYLFLVSQYISNMTGLLETAGIQPSPTLMIGYPPADATWHLDPIVVSALVTNSDVLVVYPWESTSEIQPGVVSAFTEHISRLVEADGYDFVVLNEKNGKSGGSVRVLGVRRGLVARDGLSKVNYEAVSDSLRASQWLARGHSFKIITSQDLDNLRSSWAGSCAVSTEHGGCPSL